MFFWCKACQRTRSFPTRKHNCTLSKASASAWRNQRQFRRMIYLDYNATTPLCEPARTVMLPFLGGNLGNPSSVHAAGREARARSMMRATDSRICSAQKRTELIFTSGGTEANNLAILGLARSRTARGKHLISAKTEHHAVLNAIEHLEKHEGFEVTWLNVTKRADRSKSIGRFDPRRLRARFHHAREQRDWRDSTAA